MTTSCFQSRAWTSAEKFCWQVWWHSDEWQPLLENKMPVISLRPVSIPFLLLLAAPLWEVQTIRQGDVSTASGRPLMAIAEDDDFCREGPWQRCWASANPRTLKWGATLGALQIIVVVFLFSFGGLLASWAGLFVPVDENDYGNTILFTLLSNQQGGSTPTVSSFPPQVAWEICMSCLPDSALDILLRKQLLNARAWA